VLGDLAFYAASKDSNRCLITNFRPASPKSRTRWVSMAFDLALYLLDIFRKIVEYIVALSCPAIRLIPMLLNLAAPSSFLRNISQSFDQLNLALIL